MEKKHRLLTLVLIICILTSICAYTATASGNKHISQTILLSSFDKTASEWYSSAELFAACIIGDATGSMNESELTIIAEATVFDALYVARDSNMVMLNAFGKDKLLVIGFNSDAEKAVFFIEDLDNAYALADTYMPLLKSEGSFSVYKKIDGEKVQNNISMITTLITTLAD